MYSVCDFFRAGAEGIRTGVLPSGECAIFRRPAGSDGRSSFETMNDYSGYDVPVPSGSTLITPDWLEGDTDEPETTAPDNGTDADGAENA